MTNHYEPIQTNTMSDKDKLMNAIWNLINKTIFRFSPTHFNIFRKYRVLLIRIFGGKIDWNVSIHPTAKIDYPWNLNMQNKSSLGEKSWIYAMAPINIGELTCIGKNVYLLTGSHDITSNTFNLITKSINIGSGCWVATSSIILPGINIGEYSIIAAGSVVTKNVEPWTVVGGNPAKFIKERIIKE